MVPGDVTLLTHTCLFPAQFLRFESQLKMLPSEHIQSNQDRNGKNLKTIMQEMFSGMDQYVDLKVQAWALPLLVI